MIRANAVEVTKIYQALCRLPGCDWEGDLWRSYQAANSERQAHLAEHREREAGETS